MARTTNRHHSKRASFPIVLIYLPCVWKTIDLLFEARNFAMLSSDVNWFNINLYTAILQKKNNSNNPFKKGIVFNYNSIIYHVVLLPLVKLILDTASHVFNCPSRWSLYLSLALCVSLSFIPTERGARQYCTASYGAEPWLTVACVRGRERGLSLSTRTPHPPAPTLSPPFPPKQTSVDLGLFIEEGTNQRKQTSTPPLASPPLPLWWILDIYWGAWQPDREDPIKSMWRNFLYWIKFSGLEWCLQAKLKTANPTSVNIVPVVSFEVVVPCIAMQFIFGHVGSLCLILLHF